MACDCRESDDGLTWRRPHLGVVTFEGSKLNNIVWDFHGASVFKDDTAPPHRRYQAVGFCRRYRNVFLISSADGIQWDDSDRVAPVAERANEGCFNVIWDPVKEIYLAVRSQAAACDKRSAAACDSFSYQKSPFSDQLLVITVQPWTRDGSTVGETAVLSDDGACAGWAVVRASADVAWRCVPSPDNIVPFASKSSNLPLIMVHLWQIDCPE